MGGIQRQINEEWLIGISLPGLIDELKRMFHMVVIHTVALYGWVAIMALLIECRIPDNPVIFKPDRNVGVVVGCPQSLYQIRCEWAPLLRAGYDPRVER